MDDVQVQGELLRGNIDTIILKCLFEGDKYGNEVLKDIEDRTGGQFIIKQPTLYSSLTRLENQGLVTCTWVSTKNGGRRKYFSLTEAGKDYFNQKQREWEFSRTVVDKLISEKIFDLEPEKTTEKEEIKVRDLESADQYADGSTFAETTEPSIDVSEMDHYEAESVPSDTDLPVHTDDAEEINPAQLSETSFEEKSDDVSVSIDRLRPSTQKNSYADSLNTDDDLSTWIADAQQETKDPNLDEPESSDDPTEDDDLDEIDVDSFFDHTEEDLVEEPSFDYDQTEQPAAVADETQRALPTPPVDLTGEEVARHQQAWNILYSEPPKVVIPTKQEAPDERENDRDDYRAILSKLMIGDQDVTSEPTARPSVTNSNKEVLDNGLVLRRHNRDITKQYNEKYYVYSNKLRMFQYIFLTLLMIAEIAVIYLSLAVGAKITDDIWLYYTALGLSLAFPIIAGALYVNKPDQMQYTADRQKNGILKRLFLVLECFILIICINLLIDNHMFTKLNTLPRLIIPCIMALNILISGAIKRLLLKSKRFAVK